MHATLDAIENKIIKPDLDVYGLLGDALAKYRLRHYSLDDNPARPFGDNGRTHYFVNEQNLCILSISGRTTSGYKADPVPVQRLKAMLVNALAEQHYTGEINGKDSLPMLATVANHFDTDGWIIHTADYQKSVHGAQFRIQYRKDFYQYEVRANPVYGNLLGELGFSGYQHEYFIVNTPDNQSQHCAVYTLTQGVPQRAFWVEQRPVEVNEAPGIPVDSVMSYALGRLSAPAYGALDHVVKTLLEQLPSAYIGNMGMRQSGASYDRFGFTLNASGGTLSFEV